MASKNAGDIEPKNPLPKPHPWRVCPIGEHWVRNYQRKLKPTREKPYERIASVAGYCQHNRSRKDQLYADEMEEIADYQFQNLKGAPTAKDLGYRGRENKFDFLIRGWTRYWNDIFKPKIRLDPNLVKALIASESGFNPIEDNKKKGKDRARGLMQVTNETLGILSTEKGELKDHLVHIDQEDITEPNFNICAGVRWLFHKRQLASKKLGRTATWEEAVAEYKSYLKDYQKNPNHRGMRTFRELYKKLKNVQAH